MDQPQEKKIIVTNLSTKTIVSNKSGSPKNYIIYQIQGNDGVTYETFDEPFYKARTLGEDLLMKFVVNSRPGKMGRMYTSYNVFIPKRGAAPAQEDLTAKVGFNEVKELIKSAEKNIIAAIKMLNKDGKIEIPDAKDVPKVEEVDDDIQEIDDPDAVY